MSTIKQEIKFRKQVTILQNKLNKNRKPIIQKDNAWVFYKGSKFDIHPRHGYPNSIAIETMIGHELGMKELSPTQLAKFIIQKF